MYALCYCDKCGEPVYPWNDAVRFDLLSGALDKISATFCQSRHLLPEGNCEGSPSRAQYITGIPDKRAEYSYRPDLRERLNEIHKQMVARLN